MAEITARLGAAVDFAEAAALLRLVLGVEVSEITPRRQAYAAGMAALAVDETALQRVEEVLPAAPDPPERLQVSLDATKVPLVGGAWTDVKLAAFAELVPGAAAEDGRPTLEAVQLSYAARWEPTATFGRTVTLEAQRRGVDEAGTLVSPNDGAEWIQGVLDLVAPRAVRILDEPHAAEHLGAVAGLVHGEGTPEASSWVATQRARLLEEGPAAVLAELARCRGQGPRPGTPPDAAGLDPAERLAREVRYFEQRADQLRYVDFRRAGYPIGSGIVESGHKVVIGRRFKGAGHHWAPAHLNPLLVLRTSICNDRWAETWPASWAEQQRRVAAARRRAHQGRQAARAAPAPPPAPAAPAPRPKLVVDGRPTAAHPWRRFSLQPAPRRAG
ncbi:MAG TPA: hypothetical protein VF310_04580 [Vicinamibacteria bacterium]